MIALVQSVLAETPGPVKTVPWMHNVTSVFIGIAVVMLFFPLLPLAGKLLKISRGYDATVQAPWGARHVALIVLVFIVSNVLAALSLGGTSPSFQKLLIVGAASFLVAIVVALRIALRYGPLGLHAFGLRNGGNFRAVLIGLVLYVVFTPTLYGATLAWNSALDLFGHVAQHQRIIGDFSALSPGERFVPILIGVVIQPFLEEALFRGFLQPVLVERGGPLLGIIITSVLFSAMHSSLDAFVPIFVLSMLLGWVRHNTQRLTASWAVHALHNGGQFVLLFMFPKLVGV